jgi:hypothetical protein
VKRRCWITPLLGLSLMAIPLLGSYHEAYAEDLSGMVKCANDSCQISKADWDRLQAFHNRMLQWAERNQKTDEEAAEVINQYMGALARCRAEKPQRNT